jgi:putative transport protein
MRFRAFMTWLWLDHLHATQPVAQAIGILALVCVAGMSLGSIKVRGIELGTAGVLFAGIITGYFTRRWITPRSRS